MRSSNIFFEHIEYLHKDCDVILIKTNIDEAKIWKFVENFIKCNKARKLYC